VLRNEGCMETLKSFSRIHEHFLLKGEFTVIKSRGCRYFDQYSIVYYNSVLLNY
jgi:hypothetical protein